MILGNQWFYIKRWKREREKSMHSNDHWQQQIDRLVQHFQMMESISPQSSMIREVKHQYHDMASGGDGGDLGFYENGTSTCRGINYPDYPDWVFTRVLELMKWQHEN